MNCKLITENDCAKSAVLSCSPVEFLIINKALARASADEDFAESDRKIAEQIGKDCKNFEEVELTTQTDCAWK